LQTPSNRIICFSSFNLMELYGRVL
jgi:hypothetical protein